MEQPRAREGQLLPLSGAGIDLRRPGSFSWRGLRRITTSGRYIPQIDGLRFLAICSIVLFHIGQLSWVRCNYCVSLDSGIPGVIAHLDRGVPLFFALSGFILGLPFANQRLMGGKKVRIGAYFLRRVTRLEPPYILNLLFRFPMIPAARHVAWSVAATHLAVSMLYLHGAVYGTLPMVHVPSWSLEVEVQFYLIAPILAALYFRNRVVRRWLLIVTVVGFSVLRDLTPGGLQTRLHLSLASFIQYFLVGFLVSDLFLTTLAKNKDTSFAWDLASFCALSAAVLVKDRTAFYVLPLLFVVILVGAFKGTLLSRFTSLPFVCTFGGMCYSIYLTHSIVLQVAFWLLGHLRLSPTGYAGPFLIALALSVPLVLAVGVVFFVFIERPCMDRDWPQKLWNRLTGRTKPLAAVRS